MRNTQPLSYAVIRNTIQEKIPPEVGITRIEFEGPRLAIYTQKPEILHERDHIVAEIAGLIKKRIVIRSDPSVRVTELEAERTIKEVITEDAGLVQSYFDPTLGEVVLEVEKPGVAIGKGGSNLLQIVQKGFFVNTVSTIVALENFDTNSVRWCLDSVSKRSYKEYRSKQK